MSRLDSLSPACLRAMLSPEADEDLFTLLTFTGGGISEPIRIADGYTDRLSETADEIVYGLTSRGSQFIFLPFTLTLPNDDDADPGCELTMHDVTRQLMPTLRTLTGPPSVTIELVLASSPDTVEASFPGFQLGAVTYNDSTITGQLTVASLAHEPFPCHTFTPSYFSGLF